MKKFIKASVIALTLFTTSCDTLSQNSNNQLYAMYCDDANSEYYFYENLTYEISQKDVETRVYKKDLLLFSLSTYQPFELDNYAKRVDTDAGSSWWYSFDDLITLGLTIDKESKKAVYWGHWGERARYDV